VSRTACLLVPDLPLAAELRARPELVGRPVAIASSAGPRAEIVSLSREAAAHGVRRGATRAHARALCRHLVVCVASPALERAAREALLDAAFALAPRAAPAPRATGAFAAEAAVHLDAAGVGALFGSEAGFAAALAVCARSLGLPAHVAIASSRALSHVAARLAARRAERRATAESEVHVVPPGGETAFLAPLPVDLLDPEDGLAEALTRFGVRTVRELLALPRRGLSSRLGPRALALRALARGETGEPPLPAPADARIAEAIDIDHPVDRLEPLVFVLRGLLSRLLARLEARHLACGELALELALAGGGREARRIACAAPTRDLRTLVRLASHALEARRLEAPVEGVRVETRGLPVRSDQLDLFRPAGPAPAALDETLAALRSLCGEGRVGAPAVADDHRPGAFDTAPFAPSPRREPTAPGEALCPLALRALRPPVPARVLVHRQRPDRIRSAVANGRIVRLAGPWRTTGGWWSREGHFSFDHFDVQTSDGTLARLRWDHVRRVWEIDAVYD
jgi:protein ImuB